MSLSIAGADVSKATIDICVTVNGRPRHTVIDNNEDGFKTLAQWFATYLPDKPHIVCEATGKYYLAFAKYFFDLGYSVYVENPYKINKYGESDMRKTKTDKQDAILIMEYGIAKFQKLKPWAPDTDAHRVINTYTRLLNRLQASLTAEKNRIKEADPEAMPYHAETVKHLQEQIKRIRKDLQDTIKQHEDLDRVNRLLQTIPGIGKKTAPVLMSALTGTITFRNANSWVSYCGLSPTQYQSGTSVNKNRKPKFGQRHIKTAFYLPAMKAYSMGVFGSMVERMKRKGKKPMSIIAAIMRKLAVIAYYIVKTGQPYDPARYANKT